MPGTNVGITTAKLNATEARMREERERPKVDPSPQTKAVVRRQQKLEEGGRYVFMQFSGFDDAEKFMADLPAAWNAVSFEHGTSGLQILLERKAS